jgi:hypothetical protein
MGGSAMTGKEVILAAAELPLSDEAHHTPGLHYEKGVGTVRHKGGGVICALKMAAGNDLAAYQEAQGALDDYCEPLTLDDLCPMPSQVWPMMWRGRIKGAIVSHCENLTEQERQDLLFDVAALM